MMLHKRRPSDTTEVVAADNNQTIPSMLGDHFAQTIGDVSMRCFGPDARDGEMSLATNECTWDEVQDNKLKDIFKLRRSGSQRDLLEDEEEEGDRAISDLASLDMEPAPKPDSVRGRPSLKLEFSRSSLRSLSRSRSRSASTSKRNSKTAFGGSYTGLLDASVPGAEENEEQEVQVEQARRGSMSAAARRGSMGAAARRGSMSGAARRGSMSAAARRGSMNAAARRGSVSARRSRSISHSKRNTQAAFGGSYQGLLDMPDGEDDEDEDGQLVNSAPDLMFEPEEEPKRNSRSGHGSRSTSRGRAALKREFSRSNIRRSISRSRSRSRSASQSKRNGRTSYPGLLDKSNPDGQNEEDQDGQARRRSLSAARRGRPVLMKDASNRSVSSTRSQNNRSSRSSLKELSGMSDMNKRRQDDISLCTRETTSTNSSGLSSKFNPWSIYGSPGGVAGEGGRSPGGHGLVRSHSDRSLTRKQRKVMNADALKTSSLHTRGLSKGAPENTGGTNRTRRSGQGEPPGKGNSHSFRSKRRNSSSHLNNLGGGSNHSTRSSSKFAPVKPSRARSMSCDEAAETIGKGKQSRLETGSSHSSRSKNNASPSVSPVPLRRHNTVGGSLNIADKWAGGVSQGKGAVNATFGRMGRRLARNSSYRSLYSDSSNRIAGANTPPRRSRRLGARSIPLEASNNDSDTGDKRALPRRTKSGSTLGIRSRSGDVQAMQHAALFRSRTSESQHVPTPGMRRSQSSDLIGMRRKPMRRNSAGNFAHVERSLKRLETSICAILGDEPPADLKRSRSGDLEGMRRQNEGSLRRNSRSAADLVRREVSQLLESQNAAKTDASRFRGRTSLGGSLNRRLQNTRTTDPQPEGETDHKADIAELGKSSGARRNGHRPTSTVDLSKSSLRRARTSETSNPRRRSPKPFAQRGGESCSNIPVQRDISREDSGGLKRNQSGTSLSKKRLSSTRLANMADCVRYTTTDLEQTSSHRRNSRKPDLEQTSSHRRNSRKTDIVANTDNPLRRVKSAQGALRTANAVHADGGTETKNFTFDAGNGSDASRRLRRTNTGSSHVDRTTSDSSSTRRKRSSSTSNLLRLEKGSDHGLQRSRPKRTSSSKSANQRKLEDSEHSKRNGRSSRIRRGAPNNTKSESLKRSNTESASRLRQDSRSERKKRSLSSPDIQDLVQKNSTPKDEPNFHLSSKTNVAYTLEELLALPSPSKSPTKSKDRWEKLNESRSKLALDTFGKMGSVHDKCDENWGGDDFTIPTIIDGDTTVGSDITPNESLIRTPRPQRSIKREAAAEKFNESWASDDFTVPTIVSGATTAVSDTTGTVDEGNSRTMKPSDRCMKREAAAKHYMPVKNEVEAVSKSKALPVKNDVEATSKSKAPPVKTETEASSKSKAQRLIELRKNWKSATNQLVNTES